MSEDPDKGKKQRQFRTFTVDPQGVAREAPISPMEDSADAETRRMMEKWEEENSSRFEKDFIGRLLAITGLLIALIAACFYDGSGVYDTYVAVVGFTLFMAGRVIMFRAAYEPTQRSQDALEWGWSIIKRISQWF